MDDLGQVQEELLVVHDRWYRLGVQLKVRPETLDRIDIRTQFHDSKDKLLAMLNTWMTTSDNTSWKTLIDALKSVGELWLASVLERKYCLTKDMKECKC